LPQPGGPRNVRRGRRESPSSWTAATAGGNALITYKEVIFNSLDIE
jgi:hypothetical protein